ncbi:pleckstrin homology domain-containing family N member 1 isoform X3 [Delphinapterus leucas]|uniref:Pleckstrin homology domain-containing family N member 1 isoform X3 n=1 Tax=Delphinapterus leucas TaxID=9749 RepID=A0A7F8KAI7_DELLE|nr:pleckstrin homology domain-containing family N member 1 isoform X3 [Delphinapterus leucas]
MCAHTVGRSGRGCLGSRSSSSRHPQSDAITVWPVGPLLYRLGALHWAVRGGQPSLPPAGWRVWRTPGRELKGSAQPQRGRRPEAGRPVWHRGQSGWGHHCRQDLPLHPWNGEQPSIPSLESQQENLEQTFLSVFKAGQRRAPVRSLGTVVHYTKVQLRFQHSQDISDCYLELFPSHLYFQAHGSEGLTFQGLLPLMELSVCPLEGSREHAFQITGPLPAPLLVLCPSQAELDRWLYHLEKQIALVGGVPRRHPAPPQVSAGNPTPLSIPTLLLPLNPLYQGPPENELPWTLQRRLTPLRTASGLQVVGTAICASRVKLQHLPSQEQWDRLLVLYPTSLAIFSEEADGLCFKGELPLSAIHINLNETEKQIRSFLIEATRIMATGCSACSRPAARTGPPHCPDPRASRGCGRPHRLWAVAEAHCPLADGPAGTRGAQHPPPTTPATPRLSPPEATLPGPHQSKPALAAPVSVGTRQSLDGPAATDHPGARPRARGPVQPPHCTWT